MFTESIEERVCTTDGFVFYIVDVTLFTFMPAMRPNSIIISDVGSHLFDPPACFEQANCGRTMRQPRGKIHGCCSRYNNGNTVDSIPNSLFRSQILTKTVND